MIKKLLVFLLFFSSIGFGQIPFEYLDNEPHSYLYKILTNEKGDKWFLQYGYEQAQEAILYDLHDLTHAYAEKQLIEDRLRKKLVSEDDKDSLQSFIDNWYPPGKYLNKESQFDSVINELSLNITPLKQPFDKNFIYKITLKSVTDIGKEHRDTFGTRFSNYNIKVYDKKGLLFSHNFHSQYISPEELDKNFKRALCWQYKGNFLGIILFSYEDSHGLDNVVRILAFNRF